MWDPGYLRGLVNRLLTLRKTLDDAGQITVTDAIDVLIAQRGEIQRLEEELQNSGTMRTLSHVRTRER